MDDYFWNILSGYLAVLYGRGSPVIPPPELSRVPVQQHFDPREFYESVAPQKIDFPRRLQRGRNL